MTNNFIQLVRLSEEHTIVFKEEMQEAFQHGFMAYYKDDNQRVGGAIITANGPQGGYYQQIKRLMRAQGIPSVHLPVSIHISFH